MKSYSIIEAAKLLKLHPNTLGERAKAGIVKAYKPGRAWVFLEADLLTYLETCTQCQSTSAEKRGGSTSFIKESAFDDLLALPTNRKRNASTINLRPTFGTASITLIRTPLVKR